MSADNGVYILQCRDQYRVEHLRGIENLYWSNSDCLSMDEPVSSQIVEMFGKCKHTREFNIAMRIAATMYNSLTVCEYGMKIIQVNKTWNQIILETGDSE